MASPALRGSQDYPDPLCFGFVPLSVSVWPQWLVPMLLDRVALRGFAGSWSSPRPIEVV